MFRWPDVAATALILIAAIVGGKLGVLPEKLVVALVMAAVAYYTARTLISKREASKKPPEDGAPEGPSEIHESGRINIRPQQPGRIVDVGEDGSVHIGPAPGTDYKQSDDAPSDTPPDGVPPVSEPDEEKKP